MTQKPDTPSGNLSDYAYEKIEAAIISAKLDFGEPLSENALATALNISKAPVRTALLELKRKGLVDIVPQSGCYVTVPQTEQIHQLLDIRVLLETNSLKAGLKADKAGLLATLENCSANLQSAYNAQDWDQMRRYDTCFHRAIVRSSGNQYMIDSFNNILPLMMAMMKRFMITQKMQNKAIDDHPAIIQYLREDNIGFANRLLKKHILKNKKFKSSPRWPDRRATRREYSDRDFNEVFSN